MVDPPAVMPPFASPNLSWTATLSLSHALAVAAHADSDRLYVVTADAPGIVYQVSLDNLAVESTVVLADPALALAVSGDGNTLYAATKPGAGVAISLSTFDVSGPGTLSAGSTRTEVMTGSEPETALELAALADGRAGCAAAGRGHRRALAGRP